MNDYIIEVAFLEYLKMSKLDITQMNEIQITETKRAFFAGCGYMFRALELFLSFPEDEDLVHRISDNFETEIHTFFKNEVLNYTNPKTP